MIESQYFKIKEELSLLRDEVTLKRWKLLSKAYKLGQKLYGRNFNLNRLSYDMDVPYTTVKRCMALERANKRTWELINQGKISIYKVAQICASKSITYQDEIVKLVIESDLSTCKIKSLKVNNLDDVNKERHRLAIEKGYSTSESAYRNFSSWVTRGYMFMLLDFNKLSPNYKAIILKKLKKLHSRLGVYIKKYEHR